MQKVSVKKLFQPNLQIKYQIYCTRIVNSINYLAASTAQVVLLYSGAGRLVPFVLSSPLHHSGEEVHQLVLSVEVCIESQVLITTAHIGTLSTLPVRWQSARHSADQVGLELVVSYSVSVSFSLLVSFASS